MEFSRRTQTAPDLKIEEMLTNFEGNRCSLDEFGLFKEVIGSYVGDDSMQVYPILDGCAVMGLIADRAFFTLTYNTYIKSYELCYFDADQNRLIAYYGSLGNDMLKLSSVDGKSANLDIANGMAFDLQHDRKLIRMNFKKR